MFESTQAQTTTKPAKYMTNLGVFIQSTVLHMNADKVVLNSFLKDGKAKWKETTYNGVKTKSIGFSSADTNQYVYLNEDFVKSFLEKGYIRKSDDGQFIQLDCEIMVSPTTAGETLATAEDIF